MNATPNLSMCNHDCIATLRMVQEVTRIAQNLGYRGDPLADPVPQPRTVGDLYAAGDLFLGLPPRSQKQQPRPGQAIVRSGRIRLLPADHLLFLTVADQG